jgi:hypothetical protein
MSILRFSAKFRTTLTIKSYAPPTVNSSGEYVPGAEVETAINAIVKPASSDDMLNLPEGKRDRSTYKVYTDSPIQSSGANKQGTRAIIGGELCEAVTVVQYDQPIIAHYATLFQKVTT